MYYTHLNIRPLPKDLENKLLEFAIESFKTTKNSYGSIDKVNTTSITYWPNFEEENRQLGGCATFDMLSITESLKKEILNCYPDQKEFNSKWTNISVHVLKNGSYFVPHIENRKSFFYVLETGGDSVESVWYKPTEKFKCDVLPIGPAIPFDNIVEVASCNFEKSTWHTFNHNEIHSVRGLEKERYVLTVVKWR